MHRDEKGKLMKVQGVKSDIPFADRVYLAVKSIPLGKVSTYSAVAAMAGSPNAARAVGNILHKNPYFGDVPCHRVVHADGRLADAFVFGGIGVQKRMLIEEGVTVKEEKVFPMKQFFFFAPLAENEK